VPLFPSLFWCEHTHCSTLFHVLKFHKGQFPENKNPIRQNKRAIRINLHLLVRRCSKSYESIMVIVHLQCLLNYCLLLRVSQASLFLKGTLSMMCFVPLQTLLSTLFSLSLLAKQEACCQDCNLKDLRTITLSTRHHVTQRQSIEERKERHKTTGSRLKYCSVAFSILLHSSSLGDDKRTNIESDVQIFIKEKKLPPQKWQKTREAKRTLRIFW